MICSSLLNIQFEETALFRDVEHAVELIEEWKKCKTKDADIDAQLQIREHQVKNWRFF